MSDDLISRQAAIDALHAHLMYRMGTESNKKRLDEWINNLPSVQSEPNFCRECKWSRYHINVDKHGNSETYWRCLNWDGETDEEGYCHEWERRTDG